MNTSNIQIYKFPKNNNLDYFLSNNNLVVTSNLIGHSLISLGFHHFIDRTREAMSITSKLDFKNDFYYIVNPYEINIDKHDVTIYSTCKSYLNQNISTLEFYKLWEICFIFDILTNDNINILLLNTNNNETESLQSFTNKFLGKKKDKYFTTITNNIDLIIANNIYELNENIFIDHLITLVHDILSILNKNGTLVLKVNDTFLLPTSKILFLLSSVFEETFLYKPYLSRPSDSEKFYIFKNFNNKNIDKIIANLKKIKKEINNTSYISDIYLNINKNDMKEFTDFLKFTNIKLVNQQQILINEIVKYIKDNNYFGDKYHECKNLQIQANQWWINTFFPTNFTESKVNLMNIISSIIEKNILEKTKFNNELLP